jgi:protein-S-isoprenylcysteine O-methyltransferase Ste14
MHRLPVRPALAAITAFVGLVFFSLGFASTALGPFRPRLDPSQLAAADTLRALGPLLVIVGLGHFVAALAFVGCGRPSRAAAAVVGWIGTALATIGVVDLAVAGDPLRLAGNDAASGIGILVLALGLYASIAFVGTARATSDGRARSAAAA